MLMSGTGERQTSVVKAVVMGAAQAVRQEQRIPVERQLRVCASEKDEKEPLRWRRTVTPRHHELLALLLLLPLLLMLSSPFSMLTPKLFAGTDRDGGGGGRPANFSGIASSLR